MTSKIDRLPVYIKTATRESIDLGLIVVLKTRSTRMMAGKIGRLPV